MPTSNGAPNPRYRPPHAFDAKSAALNPYVM
jgi:hypothetical protein